MITIYTLVSILIALAFAERVMYFHNGDTHHLTHMDLTGLKNNPKFVTYDCTKFDCTRYVKTQHPSLFYWRGPGAAFERIIPHTQQAVRKHFMQRQLGFLNQFKRWLEDLSLFETLVYVFMFAIGLYLIFTFLFSPPTHTHKRVHHKKSQ